MIKKVASWTGRFTNHAGREILAKHVFLALPIYAMAYVKLPVGLCKKLNSLIAKFFWSGADDGRKMHWLCWEKMTQVKGLGGLGFRDMEAFNLAMLAKQGWRLTMGDDSLFFKVSNVKYFPDSSFLEAQSKPMASWA